MRFLLMTLNGTASATVYIAVLVFIVLSIFNHRHAKHAFIVWCIALTIGFLTPNSEEIDYYWIDTSSEVEKKY